MSQIIIIIFDNFDKALDIFYVRKNNVIFNVKMNEKSSIIL